MLNADGGTRCASITGAALAIRDALHLLWNRGLIKELPPVMPVAAVSVGLKDRQVLLDLDYGEDASADADANFVMTAELQLIEVQCTAEKMAIDRQQFEAMQAMAERGIERLFALWPRAVLEKS